MPKNLNLSFGPPGSAQYEYLTAFLNRVAAYNGLFHNGKLSRGKAAMLVIKQAARIEADEVMRIKAANVENENEN